MQEPLSRGVIPSSRGAFCALHAGSAGAPVTLVLHGFPDVPDGFAPVLRALARAGRRAVAPYLRGYWPSPLSGPYDLATLARDVIHLAEVLSGDAPCDVVGHDWGAVLAYVALATSPGRFRRAVTMSVPHPVALAASLVRDAGQRRRSAYMGSFQLPFAASRLRGRGSSWVEDLYRAWSPGFEPPGEHMALVARGLEVSREGPLGYYRALRSRASLGVLRRLASPGGRIPHPTLHLTGARDGCVASHVGADDARYFDGTRERRVLDGVGHFLHLEAPERVAREITGYLAP